MVNMRFIGNANCFTKGEIYTFDKTPFSVDEAKTIDDDFDDHYWGYDGAFGLEQMKANWEFAETNVYVTTEATSFINKGALVKIVGKTDVDGILKVSPINTKSKMMVRDVSDLYICEEDLKQVQVYEINDSYPDSKLRGMYVYANEVQDSPSGYVVCQPLTFVDEETCKTHEPIVCNITNYRILLNPNEMTPIEF